MSHARYALSDDEDDVGQTTQPSSSYPSVKNEAPVQSNPLPLGLDDTQAPIGDTTPSITRLAHAWLNERGSPEVQPWNASVVESVMDQVA